MKRELVRDMLFAVAIFQAGWWVSYATSHAVKVVIEDCVKR